MRLRTRLLAMALPLFPAIALPGIVRADEAAALTPDQAASLSQAMSYITNGFAVARNGEPTPYRVVPEGDHYHLTLPLPHTLGKSGVTLQATDVTASIRPLSGSRWTFDDVRGFVPMTLTTPPVKDGKTVRVAMNTKEQSGHFVVDPSLATTSTFDATSSGLVLVMDTPEASATLHADTAASHAAWSPVGNGRIDEARTVTLQNVSYDITGKQPAKITVRAVHFDGHVRGFAPDNMAKLTAMVLDLLNTMPPMPALENASGSGQQDQEPAAPPPAADNAPGTPTPPAAAAEKPAQAADVTPPGQDQPDAEKANATADGKNQLTAKQRQSLHIVLDAVRGLISGFDETVSLDDLGFAADGHMVHLHKVAFSEAAAAPDGKADLRMRLALEGLTSPDIPPNIAHDYLPHRLVIAPHISGVPAQALFDFLSHAIDEDKPKPEEMQAMGAAMLSKGPVAIGLDELAVDLGPATLAATGSLQVAGTKPSDLSGVADIEVKGLNALIKRSGSDPLLKKAVPVLIFLKGIGDEDDHGKVTWKIAYADNKVSVNGTDMSQLIPH
jgi:hypothetical protein